MNAMELKLALGEHKDRAKPLTPSFPRPFGTSHGLFLGGERFSLSISPCCCWQKHQSSSPRICADTLKPALAALPSPGLAGRGSAGCPPLAGKASCFHRQPVSIIIGENRETGFFWCETGRKTQQGAGGNEAIIHKGS